MRDGPTGRSAVLRRAGAAVLLLVMGAGVSVALAWGAIFWRVCVSRPFLNSDEGEMVWDPRWPLAVPADWPPRPDSLTLTRDLGYERAVGDGFRRLVRRSDTPGSAWRDIGDAGYSQLLRELTVAQARYLHASPARGAADRSADLAVEHRTERYEVFRRRSGFPFLCMESSWRDATSTDYTQTAQGAFASGSVVATPWGPAAPGAVSPDGHGWTWAMRYHRGIPWPGEWRLPNAGGARFNLPLKPVWPAFGLSALFWGFGPLALLRARRGWRRRRRLERGLCPGCAYPIGVSGVCSECGGHLPIRADSLGPVGEHGPG